MKIYVLDHDTIISEAFDSIESLLEQTGESYQFMDILVDGEKKTLYKGVDY